ncbi:hypothetical protein PF003_g24053 [Phytophthora fragariae]|nr:hypothetical protein PF003_g24053 [Phytophthora fragariae]
MAAVTFAHRSVRNAKLNYENPEFELVAQGYKRTNSSVARKQPVTASLLLEMHRVLQDRTTPENREYNELVWASVVLAFFFLSRSSEMWEPTKRDDLETAPTHCVRAADVVLRDQRGNVLDNRRGSAVSAEIIYRSHKGDQRRQGTTVRHYRTGQRLPCPVEAAEACLRVRHQWQAAGKQLGIYLSSVSSATAIRKSEMSIFLKEATKRLQLNPDDYATHSIRIGGACALLVAGKKRVKGSEAIAQLNHLVQEAHDRDVNLLHYAAAIGDRDFFSIIMSSLPLETLIKELRLRNQNGMTPIESNVSPPASYQPPGEGEGNADLTRVEVGSNRYNVCSKVASTVGETLRANGIYYAAARAVYVRHVRSDKLNELAGYGGKLLAFPESDETSGFLWTGPQIAELAQEERFRASFKIYTPCTSANQQLAPGMSVLLDLENLSPTPSAEEKLIIVRYLPSPRTVDTNTRTRRHLCISDSGVRVPDKGYTDDKFLKGFRRGWYDGVYYRTVGDPPNVFLSGGNAGSPYKLNIQEEDEFGLDNRRVMIKLPDEGVVYCRGVGNSRKNPEMACVLFDSEGNVHDRYGYRGKLGRWNDIFQ